MNASHRMKHLLMVEHFWIFFSNNHRHPIQLQTICTAAFQHVVGQSDEINEWAGPEERVQFR